MKNNFANNQINAQKQALIKTLGTLFAQAGWHLETVDALASVGTAQKRISRHHVDCILVTDQGKTYYFCFGYSKTKNAENPFFIRLLDSWFDGTKLVAKSNWLLPPITEAMKVQNDFLCEGITVRFEELRQAA